MINKEKVAATALRLIDEEGLDALSMDRLAQEMAVRGPSLYPRRRRHGYERPTIRPSSSRSIEKAAGRRPRPGMVRMSPQMR